MDNNYDLLFSNDYALESYDSLFDDSYGIAYEASSSAKETLGTKIKNLLIKFKNFIADFLKNAVSVLTGSKDKSGKTIHRSIFTFIKDMVAAAKKDAIDHYNETHNAGFLGDLSLDLRVDSDIDILNQRYNYVATEATSLLNEIAFEGEMSLGEIDTQIKNSMERINKAKNDAIAQAKKNNDSSCLKAIIKGYDGVIKEFHDFISRVKKEQTGNSGVAKYLDKVSSDVDKQAKADKGEIKDSLGSKEKIQTGIYKVESVQNNGVDGTTTMKLISNAGKTLYTEADSQAKAAFAEANKNGIDTTSSTAAAANAGSSNEGFFGKILTKFSIFIGTLTRFFKYTWNGILVSISIRNAERVLANAKKGLYGSNSAVKARQASDKINEANSKRLAKSSFIAQIAEESYNEGYQAAMESLLSKDAASRMIEKLKKMTEDSYDLDPKDKKAVKDFINKYEDKADDIDKIISENSYGKEFSKDAFIYLGSMLGSALLLPIPVIGVILSNIMLFGSTIAYLVISFKKTNRLNEIAAQLDKLRKSVNRLADNNNLDADDRKKLQKLADKLH